MPLSCQLDRHPEISVPRHCADGTPVSRWSSWPWPRNAAATAIPKRMRSGAVSRVRFAGLQETQPALDTAPLRECTNRHAESSYHPLEIQKRQKWSKEIRLRLSDWVGAEIVPRLKQDLVQQGLPATVRAENDKVFIDYMPLVTGTGYVAPAVMLEFGARSTGEPSELRTITCDAAAHLRGVEFPRATPRVMRAERTFWEKATAIHVFCIQGAFRGGDRFARHWHDVTRLDAAGFVKTAIADKTLARAVADHKSMFFAEKNPQGEVIDYHATVSGGLQLIPKPDEPEPNKDYDRRLTEDGEIDHDHDDIDGTLCGESSRRVVVL